MFRIIALVMCASAIQLAQGRSWNKHDADVVTPENHVNAPETKHVPHYIQALYNYTHFEDEFSEILHQEHPNVNVTKVHILLAVIDGLINSYANRDWVYYDALYESDATAILEAATKEHGKVIERLRCIDKNVQNSIQPLLNQLKQNLNLHDVCKSNDQQCDLAIQALLSAVEDLSRQGDILLALGQYVSLYQTEYKELLENTAQLSYWEMSMFIVSAKDILKPLIKAGADIRKMLGVDRCDPLVIQRVLIHE